MPLASCQHAFGGISTPDSALFSGRPARKAIWCRVAAAPVYPTSGLCVLALVGPEPDESPPAINMAGHCLLAEAASLSRVKPLTGQASQQELLVVDGIFPGRRKLSSHIHRDSRAVSVLKAATSSISIVVLSSLHCAPLPSTPLRASPSPLTAVLLPRETMSSASVVVCSCLLASLPTTPPRPLLCWVQVAWPWPWSLQTQT